MRPYIGVTGFTDQSQVEIALQAISKVANRPNNPYQLMVGVLVSHKTLYGGTSKFPNRYPPIEKISRLFPDSKDALNLVHFNTHNPKFEPELEKVIRFGGCFLHGFQLNICWPDPKQLELFRKKGNVHQIVLQIGKHAFERVDKNPKALVNKIRSEYQDLVDYILLDASCGYGIEIDVVEIDKYLRQIYSDSLHEHVMVGIAGGLSADNLHLISQLVKRYDLLSIDAEGKHRNKEDDSLNTEKMVAYIESATTVLY